MERFSFFIYRFNGPVMQQMFRQPRNTWQLEQGVISMLAGDLFDTPKVLWRLRLFKLMYAMCGLRDWQALARRAQVPAGAGAHANSPAAPRRWTRPRDADALS